MTTTYQAVFAKAGRTRRCAFDARNEREARDLASWLCNGDEECLSIDVLERHADPRLSFPEWCLAIALIALGLLVLWGFVWLVVGGLRAVAG